MIVATVLHKKKVTQYGKGGPEGWWANAPEGKDGEQICKDHRGSTRLWQRIHDDHSRLGKNHQTSELPANHPPGWTKRFFSFSQNQFLVNLTDDPNPCPVCAKRSSSLQRNNGCNIPFQHGGATHGYSYQNCNIFASWVFSMVNCQRNLWHFFLLHLGHVF